MRRATGYGRRVRLVTFNLWSGRSLTSKTADRRPRRTKRVDLELLRAAIIELDPDVLALQEVDRRQSRSQHADLAEVAAEAMGAADYRFVPTLAGTPGASGRCRSCPPGRPASTGSRCCLATR